MHISIILPSLQGGGAEKVAVNLLNHWHRAGLQVEIVLMQREGELLRTVDPQINIYTLNVSRIRHSILPLIKYFYQRRPNVTLVGLWPLTSLTIFTWLIAGKPGVIFAQDHINLSVACNRELHLNPLYLRGLIRVTYPFATGLMAVSEGVKQDMCDLGGFMSERVQVIYNPVVHGVQNSAPADVSLRQQLWGPGYDFHILSVGSLKTQKNFPHLLHAFSLLPRSLNAKLTILGDGSLRPELENLIFDLDLVGRVHLPGFCLDPAPWYRTSDLFVLSSCWEGFANVIVEALEFGLPVVSTDCCYGPTEILDNGRYGTLVPVGDADALACAVKNSLLRQHDRVALMRRAQDFSVCMIADQYLAYFRSMGGRV